MAEQLEDEQIVQRLEKLEIWGKEADKLVTRVEFDEYKYTVFFANMVFTLAEADFHHPEVKVGYGFVEIDLWSHDAEGITAKDFELAEKIEEKLGQIKWG